MNFKKLQKKNLIFVTQFQNSFKLFPDFKPKKYFTPFKKIISIVQ
jgi:hypothetical protein